MRRPLLFAIFAVAACAPVEPDPPEPDEPEPKVFDDIDGSFEVVAERPVTFFVPDAYDGTAPTPLVLLLHGYGVNGGQMDAYLDFRPFANESNFIFASPTGTIDASGAPFWNASEACCDFAGTGVDDSGYLRQAIDEAKEIANVDAKRVFIIGHSNGGFMAQRVACDHADVIAGIISVAGAASSTCENSEPVSMLQVHGTNDQTILYEGGSLAPGLSYPGALDTASAWAERNGCTLDVTGDAPVDIETIAGAETAVDRFGCGDDVGAAVELWTSTGGTHLPSPNASYLDTLYAFLTAHPKQ